jgi:hypothetical protein
MTIDFESLASSATTITALAPRTRVTKPNPFMPVVIASFNSGEPKQVGPLSPDKPSPDGKSPLEQVHAMASSAGQTFKKERGEANEAVTVTVRKTLIPNTETGKQEGYVQIFAAKEGSDVPTASAPVEEPTRGRRARA